MHLNYISCWSFARYYHCHPKYVLQYSITLARSLSQKPIHSALNKSNPTSNPFDPPDKHLVVEQDFTPHYTVVLNKFCIQQYHIILCTKEFIQQTTPLDLSAFTAISKCFVDGSDAHTSWIVFYNSGSSSGASQPHKHIQLIPYQEIESNAIPIQSAFVERKYTKLSKSYRENGFKEVESHKDQFQ